MGLITAVWQKLVWCGLIGGVLGILNGVWGLFHRTAEQAQQSGAADLIFDALVGTLFGLVLLGVPASLWVFGKWAFHGGKIETAVVAPLVPGQVTTHEVAHDAGHAAMVGSTAAIPGAIIGTAGGLFLAAMALCVLFLFSIIGITWYNDVVSNHLWSWFGVGAGVGALTGFLGGTFLGSAIGAIFGGVRALSRH